MTRVVRLAQPTRRLQWRWTAVALVSVIGAGSVAVAAGGSSLWLRMLLTAVALERCHAAIRHRTSLTPFVVVMAVALAIVPMDADLDRTFVSAVGGALIVAAAECAHVARRLVTVAPVDETTRDVEAVAVTLAAGVVAIFIAVAVAQLDRWSARGFVAGAALAAGGIAVLAATAFPAHRRTVTGDD
jgi:hypothetical protein